MDDRKLVLDLINEFGDQFTKEIWPVLPLSEYGNFESLLLYCFLRHFKPQRVAELGTEHQGRTTYIIQKALTDNGDFKEHLMFDLPDTVSTAFMNLGNTVNTNHVSTFGGLIQQTSQKVDWSTISYLFIDADHARDFAIFYLDTLVPKLKDQTLVHIHDINLSRDWLWRPTPGTEAEELIERHLKGTLQLEKMLWVEDWCLNPEYEEDFNKIAEKYPYIGKFPCTMFPATGSASYWRKKDVPKTPA